MFKIMYANNGAWVELIGHGCRSLEEADQYVASFGTDMFFVSRPDREAPECPQPERKPLFAEFDTFTDEEKAASIDAVKIIYDALKEITWR